MQVHFYCICLLLAIVPQPRVLEWFGRNLAFGDVQLSVFPDSALIPKVWDANFSVFSKIDLINKIVVTFKESVPLDIGVDESYEMWSQDDSIYIESQTEWGALHALQTLKQFDRHFHDFYVKDYPDYAYRGIMIDSGRNFLSLSLILEQIEIMATCKLNVLHWHMTDSQLWPLLLDSYPEMACGAYSENEVYTKQDISRIVSYAYARGISVIPEIDAPGHANAGYRCIGDIVACKDADWNGYAVEPPPGQLKVTNESLKIVGTILNELAPLFPSRFFHVGADEVQESCYGAQVQPLMQRWVDGLLPVLEKSVIMWEDVLTLSNVTLPHDVTLQVWKTPIADVIDKGFNVIVSSAQFLYLDCGFGGWVEDSRHEEKPENREFNYGQAGSWCGPYKTWQRIYHFDFAANLTAEQKKRVLGAEAPLWSEQVDSLTLTSKLWPRAAALAESTWGRLRNFSLRIWRFRERLAKLGYAVSAIAPKYCLQHPHRCSYASPGTHSTISPSIVPL